MRPLTHREWEQHYVELRPYVLEEWPDVDRQRLETVDDDYEALVEVIHKSTGQSADLVRQRLRKLDVDELGIGTGERPRQEDNAASLDQLSLGAGFSDSERDRIVDRLQKLNRRLRRFPADGTFLELSVKDRDTNSQKVTLECEVPKFSRLVATSDEPDLKAALMEVRDDMWRQIDDAVNRRKEPVH